MDFFTALLEPQTLKTDALKPRLPALFEPLSVVDAVGVMEETREVEAEPPRRHFETPRQVEEGARGKEGWVPYRGIMNLPVVEHRMTETDAGFEVQNGLKVAAKTVEEGISSVRKEDTVERGSEQANAIRPQRPERESGIVVAEVRGIRPAIAVETRVMGTKEDREGKGEDVKPAAPIVRVSIGRIVVRAVTPAPSAPTKRRAETKKLSLDDYLKKGERGER